MRYIVYNTVKLQYITNDPALIFKPDGRLASNDYSDEIGIPHCIALFSPTDAANYYIDEVNGTHYSGCGWASDGSN